MCWMINLRFFFVDCGFLLSFEATNPTPIFLQQRSNMLPSYRKHPLFAILWGPNMEWMASVDLSTPKLVDQIIQICIAKTLINVACVLYLHQLYLVFEGKSALLLCILCKWFKSKKYCQHQVNTCISWYIACILIPIWSVNTEHESRIQTTSHSTTVGSTRESPKYKQRIDTPKHPQSCPNNKQLIIYLL